MATKEEKNKIEQYVEMLEERTRAFYSATETIDSSKEKLNTFILHYINTTNLNANKEDIERDFITYKTIKFLKEKECGFGEKEKSWLERKKEFIKVIESYEAISETRAFNQNDLKAYYIVGSKAPAIFDKEIIESVFNLEAIRNSVQDLNNFNQIVEAIMLKRKIDSLDDNVTRSVYYDIIHQEDVKEQEALEKEIERIKARYASDILLENKAYERDPYYISLNKKLEVASQRRKEHEKQLMFTPVDELKESLYRLLSNNQKDYEQSKKNNDKRKHAEHIGYDITNIDKDIEQAAINLHLLGVANNQGLGMSLPTMISVYKDCEKMISLYQGYREKLINNELFGLLGPLKKYDEIAAEINLSIEERKRLFNQQEKASKPIGGALLKKIICRVDERFGKGEKVNEAEVLREQIQALVNGEKELEAQKENCFVDICIGIQQMCQEYNHTLEYPRYKTIRELIKEVYKTENDSILSSEVISKILNAKDITDDVDFAVERFTWMTIGVVKTLAESQIIKSIRASEEGFEKAKDKMATLFENEVSSSFPNFKVQDLTIDTITQRDIDEEILLQQAHYDYLCAIKEGEKDEYLDKVFEIITPDNNSSEDELAMSQKDFCEKVRQYVKINNSPKQD